jgi:two-component system CheB/CheR fusion protein
MRTDRAPLTLLSIEDVTDAKQAEALRIDAATLRLVDRRKDEFLGILAHELRNPLAPMRFALELLNRTDGESDDVARVRQVLTRQVDHMVRIVDDLLDVSRIAQGKVELRKEHVRLSRIVESAVELCRPVVNAAQHVLTVSIPDEPVVLDADPIRLTQVLANLLNNAVKFTPPGGHIWLLAETIGPDAHAPDQIQIRVRDTGTGVAPEMRPRIFEMFVQGDLSLERTRGGLGVGLTLVRSLVLQHGGSVDVQSDGPGTGSEFIVRLPLESSLQHEDQTRDRPSGSGAGRPLRILVADDYQDSRELLTLLLSGDGHTVVAASDGPSALAAIRSHRPDVAVRDIGMPGMSGYRVAEAVRNDDDLASIRLVALSGLGQSEDKERARAAGFDAHFTKPVDIDVLRGFITAE